LFFMFLMPALGFVHADPNPSVNKLPNPFQMPGVDTLYEFIEVVINNVILPIGSVVVVMAFIWTGYLFVVAQGQPDKLETARRAFLYTVIGTAVLLGAWTLTLAIKGTIWHLSL